jgi:hypothetical protein
METAIETVLFMMSHYNANIEQFGRKNDAQ